MASQKEILGHYLYNWFLGNNVGDPPKGIRKDYNPQLLERIPTYWSDIRKISPHRQMVVRLTIIVAIGCLEKQIHPLDTGSLTENFHEIAWKALVEGDDQKNLSPFLQLLVDKGMIKDPDESEHAVVHNIEWMSKAWETTYNGEHHRNLLTNIRHSIATNPYENTAAIIQSSGFGKSRTVDEMATLVATIPMNIRDTKGNDEDAYPPPDENLTNLFKFINSNVQNMDGAVQAFHQFFTILFRQFSKKVDALLQSDGDLSLPVLLRNDLARSDSRSLLYKTVCEEYRSGALVAKKSHNAAKELGGLIAKLKPTKDNPVSLILYVDEAHTLTELKIRTTDSTLYDAMIKAAAEYCNYRFFILFLSTSSQLRRLTGPAKASRSARRVGPNVIAPFTEMPFDCHLEDHGIKSGLILQGIQEYRFITRFGRPLWASAFLSHNRDRETQIRKLAVARLTGLSHEPTILGNLEYTPRLAILDTLLNLEYSPAKFQTRKLIDDMVANPKFQTRKLIDDMVANRMRTAFSVPTDHTSMYSGYPSEPVLAEAALDTIQMITSPSCQEPMAKMYNELSDDAKEALDVGQRGENVAKIILLRAYMAAVKQELPDAIEKDYPWRNGCSLITFLKQLTATTYHRTVMKSRPDTEVEGKCLDEAFENAWVRFTHFARGTDDSAMTTSMAWVAFVRGMAMIGWPAQDSVDLHIPVLLHKDEPITETNMSGILVQVKLRREWSKRSAVAVDADQLGYFPGPSNLRGSSPDETYKSRPYISLVMELSKPVTEKFPPSLVVNVTGNRKKVESEKQKQKTHGPLKMHYSRTSHPRYSLFFYGRSHRVYGCIPDDQSTQDAYNALLDIGAVASSMINAHPKGRDRKYIYQMKPFWTIGKDCFHWVEDEFLNDPASTRVEDKSEEVLIGDNTSMDVDQSEGPLDIDLMDWIHAELLYYLPDNRSAAQTLQFTVDQDQKQTSDASALHAASAGQPVVWPIGIPTPSSPSRSLATPPAVIEKVPVTPSRLKFDSPRLTFIVSASSHPLVIEYDRHCIQSNHRCDTSGV
ncbi:hypothetical protein CVT25_012384 [Psilocybe cyanescens]|uniref:Uncharacterized protein n=1 Tax=Psilocybe cyanescens TaxID=93625 RepID=A0A409X7P7_PSICY|nr:hypothetical protein CVT25_012384 [Psilocybe cyanescens]